MSATSHGNRALPTEAPNDEDLATIRSNLQQQRAYGRKAFQAIVEAKSGRFATIQPAHHPVRSAHTSGK